MRFDQETQNQLLSYLRKKNKEVQKIEYILANLPEDFDPEGSKPNEIESIKIFDDLNQELFLEFAETNNAERVTALAMFFREIGLRVNPQGYNEK